MSKCSESFSETIGSVAIGIFWCFVIYSIYSGWNSDWSLEKFFDKSVKKEKWIEIEREGGTFSGALDNTWAYSLISDTEVKVKIRDSLNKENPDKMDLAVEIHTNLPHPVLANPDKYEQIDYGLFFEIKFIDEDGFIIDTIHDWWHESKYKNENYEKIDLRHFWNDVDAMNLISKFIIDNRLNEKIFNKTVKIVYTPDLKVINYKLKQEKPKKE
jgi:hypothetical protein